jgi:putative ABC transport system permease protein
MSAAADIRPLLDSIVGEVKRPLYVLLAATICVLLIACLNVANLLVARAAARRKELAIRSALGGGRMRLLRERLIESLLLAAAGGSAGLLLAYGAVQWLVHTRQDMSRVEAIHIDGAVAAFTVGLVVLCAFFAGLISSLSIRGSQLLASLQESSRGSSAGQGRARLRRSLLAAEVGLTVVLLVAAGLLLKSYAQLRSSQMGCITKNVLTMRIGLFGGRYADPAQQVNFFASLLERGRSFDPSKRLDRADEAVVSKSFVDQYLPGEDPLGKHLRVQGHGMTIVGVVGDTRYAASEVPRPMLYFPLYAGIQNNGTLVIRSNRDVEPLALPVHRIVGGLDHDLPVSNVPTMDQLLGKSTQDASFNATLLLGFAILSLVLAGIGLFGVLAYIVAQRTSEIGIRLALGAPRKQVLCQVLLDGLRPALFGLTFGLAASAGVARLIRSMLYGTQPLDPTVFAAVAATLLLVAVLACLVPAWRAARLAPMQALRME